MKPRNVSVWIPMRVILPRRRARALDRNRQIEAPSVPVVDLGVDRRREALAADAGEEVRGGHRGHLAAGRPRRRRDVRHDQAVVEADQRMVDRDRLGVRDVQGGRGDRAVARARRRGPSSRRPGRATCSRGRRSASSSRAARALIRPRVSGLRSTWSDTKSDSCSTPSRVMNVASNSASTDSGDALRGRGRGSASRSPSPAAPPPGRSARTRRSRSSRRGRPGPCSSIGPQVRHWPSRT